MAVKMAAKPVQANVQADARDADDAKAKEKGASGKIDRSDLLSVHETVPVTVEEGVTLGDFQYVGHVICGPGIDIDFSESMYCGCSCVPECNENYCPCILRFGQNYDKEGNLLKAERKRGYCLPIFECNSSCPCHVNCNNRLSQQGIKIRLQIFQTKDKGLGVRTLQSIRKSQYIGEYSGEIISYDEAKQRAAKIGRRDKNYILVLREHVAEGQILRTHIDATTHGNVARFMNHSCDPNMDMLPVRVNNPVPRLCLFALRDIESGEELTFNYGSYSSSPNSVQTSSNPDNKRSHCGFKTSGTDCLCGSDGCVGYLPFDERLYES